MRSHRYEDRRLRLMASETTGETVLDIGYASAPNAHLAARRVVGLDIAEPPARVPDCYEECIVGDATNAAEAVGRRTFDTVLAAELIEHLENPYEFLRSVRSCMHEHSKLVISTPNPLAPPVLFYEMARSPRRYFADDHTYYFLPRWVGRMLESAGLEVRKVIPVGFGHPLFAVPSPVWMSYQVIYVAGLQE